MAQFFKIPHASYKWIYSPFPIIILYFLPELPFAHCSQLQSRAQVKNGVWLPSRGCYKLEWARLSSRGQKYSDLLGSGLPKASWNYDCLIQKKREQNCPTQKKIDFQITNKILPWICPMKYLRYIYTKKKKLNLNLIWKAQCFILCAVLSHSVVSDSLRPHGL